MTRVVVYIASMGDILTCPENRYTDKFSCPNVDNQL